MSSNHIITKIQNAEMTKVPVNRCFFVYEWSSLSCASQMQPSKQKLTNFSTLLHPKTNQELVPMLHNNHTVMSKKITAQDNKRVLQARLRCDKMPTF